MLSNRSHVKEEMDNFDKQDKKLADALNRLSLINKILGNTWNTLNAVKKVFKNKDQEEVVHIIDLGCGAGDNLRAIASWCARNNRDVKLTGIDGNKHILSYAQQQQSDIEINYEEADILDQDFTFETCDILISSHFIYRFTDQEIIDFIERSKDKVRDSIIFSELQRHLVPYYLFMLSSKLLFFNVMARHDGLRAIRNSFKKKELQQILEQLETTATSVKWNWAFRYLITIKL